MISLAGQTALVTGGSRGIGRATALLLARAGADVAITYLSRDRRGRVGRRRRSARWGAAAVAVGGDLADPESADRMADAVRREFGRLDCFVANAGIWPPDDVPLGALAAERWRATMAANLDAVFLSTRAALGTHGRRAGGSCSSRAPPASAARRSTPTTPPPRARSSRSPSRSRSSTRPDILVNCVAPGWVDTEMCAPAFAGDGRERSRPTIPLRRIPPPEDIAGPILFLCSDLARHVTGEVLNVNGGSVLCG